MRRAWRVSAAVVLGVGLLAGACNKDGGAGGEAGLGLVPAFPGESAPSAPAAPAAAVEDAAGAPVGAADAASAATTDTGPPAGAASAEEIARFAAIVAEIDCTADRFEDPVAHASAISAILTRAGLTRDQYDARVMGLLEDPAFNATRERSLAVCKATAVAPGAAEDEDGDATLRQKMMTLAVASECMRKGGATSAEMAPALLALYRAHEVDVETYAREMGRLQTNAQFQEEVARRVAECPTGPAAAAGAADAGAGDEGDPGAAADGGEAAVAELPPAEPAKPADGAKPPATPPVVIAGVYKGSVSGGGSVKLTVGARGNIDPAMLTIAGRHYRAKGRVAADHSVQIGVTEGRDTVQLKGTLDPLRRQISGTWSGVVGGERKSGSFTAKR